MAGIRALTYRINSTENQFRKGKRNSTVFLSCDTKPHSGRINVFCGPNNSGKSYLIDTMHNLLSPKSDIKIYEDEEGNPWRSSGVYEVLCNDFKNVNSLKANIFSQKNIFGFISNRSIQIGEKHNRHVYSGFVSLILQILSDQIDYARRSRSGEAETSADLQYLFWNSKNFRSRLFENLKFDQPRYRPADPKKNRLFSWFERYTSSSIGICRTEKGVNLCYRDQGVDVNFEHWSDGVKALACLESMLEVNNFEVLFIDELENHLHPMLISEAMEIIKKSGVQAIITTHHPHIVFSRLVDKVFFIERSSPNSEEKTLRRIIITELKTNFEKIFNTYNLFSNKDDALIKQSRYVRHASDIKFYSEFMHSFGYDVASSKAGWAPDSQSDFLSQILEDLGPRETYNVLDVGAGLGRTLTEVSKTRWNSSERELKWTLWEPSEKSRFKIRDNIEIAPNQTISIPDERDNIPLSHFDFSLIINVLHELTSRQVADVLLFSLNALNENGVIIIGELYPLIHAEKCAVPYNDETLKDILAEIGVETYVRPFTFYSGAGYYLIGQRRSRTTIVGIEKAHQSVRQAWGRMRSKLLRDYVANPGKTGDIGIYRQTIQTMHTIASIDADLEGFWK